MISVFGSRFDYNEELAVESVLQSQWVGMGSKVEEFENKFKDYKSLTNFLMIDSCSNGLYLALKVLDLPKDSEVIVPSFTWVACAQSILMNGLKPVFCDVELDTMNVSVRTIQEKITINTSAIMIVHYAGLSVDIDSITELGYPIIEDCAHSVNTNNTGIKGDVSVWSFDSVKNLAVGEGGGISFKEGEYYDRAKKLRYCGIGKAGFSQIGGSNRWWEYDISDVNIKMLPTDISAAIGIEQLKKLQHNQKIRKNIWKRYQKELNSTGDIIHPICDDNHSYFTYSIRTECRDELANYLLENGIYTTLRYHPLHMNKIYKTNDKLINSEKLNETCLSIPLHPRLSGEDVEYIISKIKNFYA